MKVFIGESSYIIRKGFVHLIGEFQEFESIREFSTSADLEKALQESVPDIIIISATFNYDEINQIITDSEKLPVILHLVHSALPADSAMKTHLSVYEGKVSLLDKINESVLRQKDRDRIETSADLSPREKLVLKHVALGLTNKEIAEKLFISTHTVITHRKNITSKLGIKTVSGLTVYAILNKIVGMNDVN